MNKVINGIRRQLSAEDKLLDHQDEIDEENEDSVSELLSWTNGSMTKSRSLTILSTTSSQKVGHFEIHRFHKTLWKLGFNSSYLHA